MKRQTLPAIMKKISLIITFLLLSQFSFAQSKPIVIIKHIKVKVIKPISNLCLGKDKAETAVVLEYKVVERKARKIYGKRIYVITPCFNYPAEFSFNDKVWDLQFSENKIYDEDFKIINEELLLKNVNKKIYWEKLRSAKVTIYD